MPTELHKNPESFKEWLEKLFQSIFRILSILTEHFLQPPPKILYGFSGRYHRAAIYVDSIGTAMNIHRKMCMLEYFSKIQFVGGVLNYLFFAGLKCYLKQSMSQLHISMEAAINFVYDYVSKRGSWWHSPYKRSMNRCFISYLKTMIKSSLQSLWLFCSSSKYGPVLCWNILVETAALFIIWEGCIAHYIAVSAYSGWLLMRFGSCRYSVQKETLMNTVSV